MKIISRYILKEHFGPFTFALTALTSLMLLQYIARQFGNLVGKGLTWQVIAQFFLLSIPFTVAMTLPMAVLVAVLYAFSRLASENEITALKAGGVSMRQLLVPSLSGAFVLALVMLGFNDQILPRANHRLAVLQMAIFRTKPTFALREQILNTVKEGQLYLRAGHLDRASSRMGDVTIYDVANPVNMRQLMRVNGVASQFEGTDNPDTVSKGDREMSVCEMQAALAKADTGLQRAHADSVESQWLRDSILAANPPATTGSTKAPKRPKPPAGPHPKAPKLTSAFGVGGAYCTLLAGAGRIAGGSPAVAATKRPVTLPPSSGIAPSVGGLAGLAPDQRLNMAKLNAEQSRLLRNRYDVEIQKKFSLAASCLIFVLVGAPIALRFPRGGVGLVIGVSLFIFAIYYVGLIGGESLSDRGYISPFWAMWSTNVIMTVVGLALTLRMGREATTGRGGDIGELIETIRMWIARGGRRFGVPLERRRRVREA